MILNGTAATTRNSRAASIWPSYISVSRPVEARRRFITAATQEKADQLVTKLLAQKSSADANDLIYQYDASRSYYPAPNRDIEARLLAINSADDERNRPSWEFSSVKSSALKMAATY